MFAVVLEELLFPLGVAAGVFAGFLAWGFHLRSTRSKLTEVNTQIISLSFDRRRLANDLDKAIQERDQALKALEALRADSEGKGLVVVLGQDDKVGLERVKGIGPKTAMLLAAEGIVDLASLSNLDDVRISEIGKRQPLIVERILRERWREQAAAMLTESVDETKEEADHSRGRSPENLALEIKEPDLTSLP